MLRIKVKLLDSGSVRTIYGSEQVLLRELRRLFPYEAADITSFLVAVEAINFSGFGEVEVEPYVPRQEPLPADYATRNQGDDPWVREED